MLTPFLSHHLRVNRSIWRITLSNSYIALLAAAVQVLLGLFFALGAHLGWLLAIYLFIAAHFCLQLSGVGSGNLSKP
jgi:hypothetical protein